MNKIKKVDKLKDKRQALVYVLFKLADVGLSNKQVEKDLGDVEREIKKLEEV